MSDKNEYVKLWCSYESYFVSYSDAEVGRLARAMIQYRRDGVEPKFCGNERFVWPAIKRDIDESIKAQQVLSDARSESGKRGGRPKKETEEKQKNQMLFSESKKSHGQGQGQGKGQGNGQGQGQGQEPPNPLPQVRLDKDSVGDIDGITDACPTQEKIDYQQIVDLYHTICKSYPKILSISESRRKAIKARLNTYSVEDFKAVFEKAEASSFLKGVDGGWKASFDWLIKEGNMLKVLEGNYADKPKHGGRKEKVPYWMEKGKVSDFAKQAVARLMANESLSEPMPVSKLMEN